MISRLSTFNWGLVTLWPASELLDFGLNLNNALLTKAPEDFGHLVDSLHWVIDFMVLHGKLYKNDIEHHLMNK